MLGTEVHGMLRSDAHSAPDAHCMSPCAYWLGYKNDSPVLLVFCKPSTLRITSRRTQTSLKKLISDSDPTTS